MGKTKQVKTLYADLKDHFKIRNLIRTLQPEIVYHLAAISPVAYSYDRPLEVLETNFNATVNLAESCLREDPNLRHFIFAGTSEEYGNQPEFPIKETAEFHPNSPYAVSKVASNEYLNYLYDAYEFPVTIMRPFNTYGRRDNTHFVVERAISQMLTKQTVNLGDPTPTRDFLYVTDHVQGYLNVLYNEAAFGEAINLCTGRGITIHELMEHIKDLTQFHGDINWHTIPKRPLDIMKLVGDNAKAKKLLGWEPTVMLNEGLQRTVDWWNKRFFKVVAQ